MQRNLRLTSVAYHRNGVSADGFFAVTFQYRVPDETLWRNMVAAVFPAPDDPDGQEADPRACTGKIAVFDATLAAAGQAGFPNCWRGDEFEPWLREWIAQAVETRSLTD